MTNNLNQDREKGTSVAKIENEVLVLVLHLLTYILVVSILQLHTVLRSYTPSKFDS